MGGHEVYKVMKPLLSAQEMSGREVPGDKSASQSSMKNFITYAFLDPSAFPEGLGDFEDFLFCALVPHTLGPLEKGKPFSSVSELFVDIWAPH